MSALKRLGLETAAYPWYFFLARSGEGGRLWVDEYRAKRCDDITREIDRSLMLMRMRRLSEGAEALSACETSIRRGEFSSSIMYVLDRWYYSARAYYHYCVKEFERAAEDLDQATETIRLAVKDYPFLIMMANHCYDFSLQRARIRRNQRRWREMKELIRTGREMLQSRRPLCQLDDGSLIFISDVDAFNRSIPLHDSKEELAMREILDQERRDQIFEAIAKENFALPEVIIPYTMLSAQ